MDLDFDFHARMDSTGASGMFSDGKPVPATCRGDHGWWRDATVRWGIQWLNLRSTKPCRFRATGVLETFGCQMNQLDSELVRGHLSALGYRFTRDPDEAGVLLYNTCSVRQQAENKALSRLGLLGREKEEGRELIIGVLGCMAEREAQAC